MIRHALTAGAFLFFSAVSCISQPLPEKQGQLFLEFARDVSSGDPRIVDRARALIAEPPTTLETIGFYGMEDAPAPERTLRGIISVLNAHGHLIGVEDKYIYELPFVLEQVGWANGNGDPNLDILTGLNSAYEAGRAPTPDDWEAFRAFFPLHTKAVEASVARADRRLLSVRVPPGDTMYVWAPTSVVADKWRGRPFLALFERSHSQEKGFDFISVTNPAWDIYWDFMTYAMDIPEPFWAFPGQE